MCDDFLLDLSNSKGNCGRDWEDVKIVVNSLTDNNTDSLQAYIDNEFQIFPPTAIPYFYLKNTHTYTFQIGLTNFFQKKSDDNFRVTVMDRVVPSVSIVGDKYRKFRRSDTITLSSSVTVTACAGDNATLALKYDWIVMQNNIPFTSIKSASKDRKSFLLPPYSDLNVGQYYEIVLKATILTSSLSSEGKVTVYIDPGPLVATVLGSKQRDIRVYTNDTLDASSSYDTDYNDKIGTAAGLLFSWACRTVEPKFSDDCNVKQYLFNESSKLLIVVDDSSTVNSVFEFTCVVTDATEKRVAFTTVTVRILPELSAQISLISLQSNNGINPGDFVYLEATTSLPESILGQAEAAWSVDDDDFDLAGSSLSPSSYFLYNSITSQILVVDTKSIVAGTGLKFSLSVSSPKLPKVFISSISITTNSPPIGGYFDIMPSSGIELKDDFKLFALKFVDADVPIFYQFAYDTNIGTIAILKSKSEKSFTESVLPAGDENNSFNITCTLQVFDRYSANSTLKKAITVLNATQPTLDDIEELIPDDSAVINDLDDVHKSNSLTTYLLNKDLKETTETGQERKLQSTSETAYKECRNSCNGHGSCIALFQAQELSYQRDYTTCQLNDNTCYVLCDCQEGYEDSIDCAFTNEVLSKRKKIRKKIYGGVKFLLESENPSKDTFDGWVNEINANSINPDEISEKGDTGMLDYLAILITYSHTLIFNSCRLCSEFSGQYCLLCWYH